MLNPSTTECQISTKERACLRSLAEKQAAYAALEIMRQREKMWFDLNDGRPGARPPFVVEAGTFYRDFLPDSMLCCTSETARSIERQLLGNIRNHEIINDDKVMPDCFPIFWDLEIDKFGVPIKREFAKDSQGYETGSRVEHPITDLERDFPLLKPAQCRVDKARTLAYKAFLEELFGDLLPVKTVNHWMMQQGMLTQQMIMLMGMEAFFMAMYDTPEAVHRAMAYVRDNALRVMRWFEAEGLLCDNNGNADSFGSSFNFNTRLSNNGAVKLNNFWGAANSQETVGISSEFFHEFCAPYYRDYCEPFGLIYYGCCEPAHTFWEDIRQFPHLKKVSVNKWTDQAFMADALRGGNIVFSRKPDPNFLGVDEVLKEDAWAAHIRETLDATRGVFTEFIVRDVYTVHGNLNNARRAVEIARREIDRKF